jgi:hypothetical protein
MDVGVLRLISYFKKRDSGVDFLVGFGERAISDAATWGGN